MPELPDIGFDQKVLHIFVKKVIDLHKDIPYYYYCLEGPKQMPGIW